MYTALPSLERSPTSLSALGKLTLGSVKGVLASLLDTPFEGFRREIIEGRPSNSEVPFDINLDEYGYMVQSGFAVTPAQGRSFGTSLKFAMQAYEDMKKGDPNEAEATWSNTNLRMVGRMTAGEDSDTFKKFSGAAGQAYVSVAGEMTYRSGNVGSNFEVAKSSRAEKIDRLSAVDLISQQDGQFTLIVGAKSDARRGTVLAKEGGVRVVRYLAFYTGDVPKVPYYRLNHFCAVKPPSAARLRELSDTLALRRKLARVSEQDVLDFLDEAAQRQMRLDLDESVLSVLVREISAMPATMPDDEVVEAGVQIVTDFVVQRMSNLIVQGVAEEAAPILEALEESVDAAGVEGEDRDAVLEVLYGVMDRMRNTRVAELTVLRGAAARAAQGRLLLARGPRVGEAA
nr:MULTISPECIES: TraM recognition domain-containing protein [unclassified Xanthobacter]